MYAISLTVCQYNIVLMSQMINILLLLYFWEILNKMWEKKSCIENLGLGAIQAVDAILANNSLGCNFYNNTRIKGPNAPRCWCCGCGGCVLYVLYG